jgi:hypothetical protein
MDTCVHIDHTAAISSYVQVVMLAKWALRAVDRMLQRSRPPRARAQQPFHLRNLCMTRLRTGREQCQHSVMWSQTPICGRVICSHQININSCRPLLRCAPDCNCHGIVSGIVSGSLHTCCSAAYIHREREQNRPCDSSV